MTHYTYTGQPKLKHDIKIALMAGLFTKETQRLQAQLEDICARQRRLTPSAMCFSYKGLVTQLYSNGGILNRVILAPALRPSMDAWIKENKLLQEHEIAVVSGFITRLLNKVHNPIDCLRILPESLHPLIKGMVFDLKAVSFTEEQVQEFIQTNQTYIDMIKQRMVMNLIT